MTVLMIVVMVAIDESNDGIDSGSWTGYMVDSCHKVDDGKGSDDR